MKKLLYTLLALSIIFSACEKKEEEPINNNNNTSLSLEQTKWNVTSIIEETDGYGTYTYNLPVSDEEGWDTGLLEIEWTFFSNNGIFVEKYTNGYNYTCYDTLQYTYYENLNTILFENNGDEVSFFDGNAGADGGGVQILQFNSNNLTIKMSEGDWSFTLFLSKI